MSLEQLRDIVVIVYGVVGIMLFAILIVVAVGLWLSVRALTRAVRALLDDPVKPTIGEVRAAVQEIRGTTAFLADTAVHPLIRVVAIGRGLRRGIAVATGIGRRRR